MSIDVNALQELPETKPESVGLKPKTCSKTKCGTDTCVKTYVSFDGE